MITPTLYNEARFGYRAAKRSGRGVVLTRAKRDAVWTVFEEYRAQLASRKLKEVDDAYRDAAALISKGAEAGAYSAIVVDETQDFSSQALRLLRAIVPAGPNDLFFVGDATHTVEANEKDSHDSSKLRFATMHRAKGLEFDQVLVIAQKSAMEGDDADHNRRLAYVALTRAKKVAALLQF
jgi:superfamily I DNA/RNA helicase